MQEVFIVVHRRLDSYDEVSRITTWLYGICMRVAAGHRRKAHVRRERAVSEVPEESPILDYASNDSPEEAAMRRVERGAVPTLTRFRAERRLHAERLRVHFGYLAAVDQVDEQRTFAIGHAGFERTAVLNRPDHLRGRGIDDR